MSFILMLAAFRDQSKTMEGKYQLSGIETSVYARMALYATEDGTHIYPSINTLVAELKFSRTTIKAAIKSLLEKRRILLVKKGNSINHTANEYRLNLDLLPREVSVQTPSYPEAVDNFVDNKRFSVDNAVDKLCIKPISRAPDDPGARAAADPGARAPDDPHRLLKKTINKEFIVIQSLQNLKKELLEMEIEEDTANLWIEKFGMAQLINITKGIKVYEKQKGVKIKNKAACLYAMITFCKNLN